MVYALGTIGFILLFAGGELLVRGAVGISKRLGLSEFLIGLTVVGFATSAPELFVSGKAALDGLPSLAVGNVVGSNIANLSLVLGIASLIRPVRFDRSDIRPDAMMMLASTVALVALGFLGWIGRLAGLFFVVALVAYVGYSYRTETARGTAEEDWRDDEVEEFEPAPPFGPSVLFVVVGVIAMLAGANWMVSGATEIARAFGVSEAVVGLTVVALGTSLPEIATSVVAAVRGSCDVAVGNVLGSNIYNILLILGLTGMISPVSIAAEIARFDLPILLALSVVVVALLMTTGRLRRGTGMVLCAVYASYVGVLYATSVL
ncbi:MAG: calcium/sodium antiporter [Coriobacteriales bacterium]|nr:calcium/sodium antiporter [Coriobacteriales bacterium]